MGRKSRKKKTAAPATADPETYVEKALLEAWKSRYPSSDEDVAEQEVDLMKARGHCCYAALQEGVKKRHFDGVSNFLAMPEYIQVATETLNNLQQDVAFVSIVESQQETQHQRSVPTVQEKMCADSGDKEQSGAAKRGLTGKPQTVLKSSKPVFENTKLAEGHPKPELIEKAGGTMLEQAARKARKEMEAEFDYHLLCP